MTAYTVLRFRKIKSWGDLGAAGQHNTRQSDVINADATKENKYLIGTPNDRLEDVVRGMIGNQKIRKNAVLGIEVLLSASPEYFRPDAPGHGGVWDQGRLNAWVDASMKWLKSQYGLNIAQAILHLDEQTPHIHAIITPLDSKGRLNARALIGGSRNTLRDLQTSYADAVKELGIARGIEGSAAKHETVREYYFWVNKAFEYLPDITEPHPGPEPKPPEKKGIFSWGEHKKAMEEWEKAHAEWLKRRKKYLENMQAVNAAAIRLARENEARLAEYNRLKEQVMELKKENSRLRKQNIDLKQQIERLRGINLVDVLTTMYGAEEAKGSKSTYRTRKFKLPGRDSNIAVTENKWIDNATGKGGIGAINLVMYLEDYGQDRFRDAVKLLADRFSDNSVAGEVGQWAAAEASARAERMLPELKKEPIPVPDRVDRTWEKARNYLIDKRKIPAELVDKLHAEGVIYSDRRNNIVFLRSGGGAFVRGSYDPSDKPAFKQTVGAADKCGPFMLEGQGKNVIITEGPIDALTLKAKYPDSTVLATGGNFPVEKLSPYLGRYENIFLAHDNDTAGNDQAKRIQDEYNRHSYQQITRLLPPAPCKDWNEALMKEAAMITKKSIGDCGYEILPRPLDVGGGYRLRLLEKGEEIAGGIYPAREHKTPENSWDEADKMAFSEAEAEAESWLAAMTSDPNTSKSKSLDLGM